MTSGRWRVCALLAAIGFPALAAAPTGSDEEPRTPAEETAAAKPAEPGGEWRVAAFDATDVILHATFVPSAEKPQGEVRVLRRGDVVVVQTLLYTKVLRRTLGRIRDKELGNWPEGREGHEDASAYLEALTMAESLIETAHRDRDDRSDRRRKLIIEFVLGDGVAEVSFAEARIDETDDTVRIVERRGLLTIRPATPYVRENMRLIVADSFGIGLDAAGRLLTEPGT